MADSGDHGGRNSGAPSNAQGRLPSISLPKGGGAIRGLGEKFAANPMTGTGSMTVPIPVSPGRNGFGPELSLTYDSGAGNGPFGFGWSLTIPAITRKTDKGLPQYLDAEESDVFLLSGAEDLVPVLQPDGSRHQDTATAPGFTIHRYRPRSEGLFARIERWTEVATGDIHWRSITRDNVTTIYGQDNKSRIFDPADPDPAHPTRISSWLICESYDDKGNAIRYEYAAENDNNVDLGQANERNRLRTANRYLKRIRYGNLKSCLIEPDLDRAQWLFEVVFDYDEGHYEEVALDPAWPEAEQHRFVQASASPELPWDAAQRGWEARPDPFSSYRAGFEIRTYRRCRRVLMFHHIPDLPTGERGYDGLVRATEFDYADLDYAQPVTIEDELAHQGSTRFTSFIRSVTQSGYVRDEDVLICERNGNNYVTYRKKSLPPLEFEYSKARIQDELQELDESSRENLPVGIDGGTYQWVDLDGEGVSGILTGQGGAWHYKPNQGEGKFGATRTLRTQPSLFAQVAGGDQLVDLSGDGQLDVAAFSGPTPGFYERTQDHDWEPFRSFRQLPNIPWDDPNLRLVDLDGNGHSDVLITEQEVFTWYPSLGEDGFGPARQVRKPWDEEIGPRLVLADGTQSIYLADMSGDGFTDLVRLRNGEVSYWPNLGYGRFGAKVTMDDAPWLDNPEQFDQRRVRLADIDGSGTNDILYLGRDGVHIFFNQAGNGWSQDRPLPQFPTVDNLAAVTTADLLGNGTACLVWSSPLPGDATSPIRYVDLMGGHKPHLLTRSINNLGAETWIQYAPSTRFYLADKHAGRPWITRIPFPVHVVERVETYDHISRNRFVTRYAYHHGYFDGIEREFRGFGMVEQWDTEEIGALGSAGIAANTADDALQSQAPKYERGQRATCQIQGVWQFTFRPIVDIRPSIHVDGGWYYFFEGITSGIPEDDVLLLEAAGSHAPEAIWDGTPEEAITVRCASNLDEASSIPPVHTKTWFHTGAYWGRERISRQHARDYYGAPTDPAELDWFIADELLPDTILPAGLTADEEREACRALKGFMLRQEVYGLDGTDKQPHPYTVTEQNFTIRTLQPRGGNRHAVFLTHAREEVVYNYERTLVPVLAGRLVDAETAAENSDVEWSLDPRAAHSLTLKVDEYGNVLISAAIGYGRRFTDPSLTQPAQDEQTKTHITYTENRVTNAVDTAGAHDTAAAYRTPLPCESRTYELTGLNLQDGHNRFTFDEILKAGETATVLSYEEKPTAGSVEKRLIEHERIYYRRNDLTGPLSLCELQSMALPYETYQLAFTPGLIDQIFNEEDAVNRVSDAMLDGTGTTPGGRYVHTRDETGALEPGWWIPSGQIFFSPDPDASPSQELDYAREHFFLPHRFRDPFHTDAVSTESFVEYDDYDLLVQETRDALRNRITVGERDPEDPTEPLVAPGQDYRVLQPTLVMDPNRNRTAIAFDALGMVVGTAVMGKPEDKPAVGDRLTAGFRTDPTQAELDRFSVDPKGPLAAELLGDVTTRIIYDLTGFRRESDPARKQPAFAATLAREIHVSDLVDDEKSRIQVSFAYSDGFGREIQQKIQAEPGPVPQRDANGQIIVGADGRPLMMPHEVSPRWVGSGWTVFNNKGKPIRQYEPFFTDTHRFEFAVEIGVSPVLCYDPVERVVATLHPNHTWEKVVFDPWRQETWDVNDTVLIADPKTDADVGNFFARLAAADYLPTWHTLRTDEAHQDALAARYPDATDRKNETTVARKTEMHAATPTIAHFDSLGRPFLTVEHNRFERDGAVVDESYKTRVELDIEGNQLAVIDARGNTVMRYLYNVAGPDEEDEEEQEDQEETPANLIYQRSMDSGERWMLNDVAGQPLYVWDSNENAAGETEQRRYRSVYDPLRRPLQQRLQIKREQEPNPEPELVIERLVYGEGQVGDQTNNLRGQLYRHYDSSGLSTNGRFDFKGNLLEAERRLASDYKAMIIHWPENPPADAFETDRYTLRNQYDALNRVSQQENWHMAGRQPAVYTPQYNQRGLLTAETIQVRDRTDQAIEEIRYDAKGQRLRITYGNQARTDYQYDPETFRLIHLKTTTPGKLLQDLYYSYDPAGNITSIRDNAQQTVFFRKQQVSPDCEYTYDAQYRLIRAKGREHDTGIDIPKAKQQDSAPATNFPSDHTLRDYVQTYQYDSVGNIDQMQHVANNGNWTRNYEYADDSNRLLKTWMGNNESDAVNYRYDTHGSMLNLNRAPDEYNLTWDTDDMIRHINLGGGGNAWYNYDADKQRTRKQIVRSGTVVEERLYLGGMERYRRWRNDLLVEEIETYHLMDGEQRVLLIEDVLQTDNNQLTEGVLFRYQLGNHLGSVALELDGVADLISYEEYHPYGTSAYRARSAAIQATAKRYRYTGMERDEESGLSYHMARYYLPWLGRWVSINRLAVSFDMPLLDEKLLIGLYFANNNNPIIFIDLDGYSPKLKKSKNNLSPKGFMGRSRQGVTPLKRSIMVTTFHFLDIANSEMIDNQAEVAKKIIEAVEKGAEHVVSESDKMLESTKKKARVVGYKPPETTINGAKNRVQKLPTEKRPQSMQGAKRLPTGVGRALGAINIYGLIKDFRMFNSTSQGVIDAKKPAVLNDEGGEYTIHEPRWFSDYYLAKKYISGKKRGTIIELSKRKARIERQKFREMQKRTYQDEGRIDILGNYKPGQRDVRLRFQTGPPCYMCL